MANRLEDVMSELEEEYAAGRADERADFVEWLRLQAGACFGERRQALLDAAIVRERMPRHRPGQRR